MKIDSNKIPPVEMPGMNGGSGKMESRFYSGSSLKLIYSSLHPGCSIGEHRHERGEDINYVLSGSGVAECCGETETLEPGVWHICPSGGVHSIRNTGETELVLLTVVVER